MEKVVINLRLSLTNPWWDRFANIRIWSGKTPWKTKFWEVQVMKSDDIVAFDFRLSAMTDHAGLDLWLGLLGYAVNLQFYDSRHWDSDRGDWVIYDGTR